MLQKKNLLQSMLLFKKKLITIDVVVQDLSVKEEEEDIKGFSEFEEITYMSDEVVNKIAMENYRYTLSQMMLKNPNILDFRFTCNGIEDEKNWKRKSFPSYMSQGDRQHALSCGIEIDIQFKANTDKRTDNIDLFPGDEPVYFLTVEYIFATTTEKAKMTIYPTLDKSDKELYEIIKLSNARYEWSIPGINFKVKVDSSGMVESFTDVEQQVKKFFENNYEIVHLTLYSKWLKTQPERRGFVISQSFNL